MRFRAPLLMMANLIIVTACAPARPPETPTDRFARDPHFLAAAHQLQVTVPVQNFPGLHAGTDAASPRIGLEAKTITPREIVVLPQGLMIKAETDGGVIGYLTLAEMNELAALALEIVKQAAEPKEGMTYDQIIKTSWGRPVATQTHVAAGVETKVLIYERGTLILSDGVLRAIKRNE